MKKLGFVLLLCCLLYGVGQFSYHVGHSHGFGEGTMSQYLRMDIADHYGNWTDEAERQYQKEMAEYLNDPSRIERGADGHLFVRSAWW